MPDSDAMPPGIVRRAATIARGPHACPTCECPTWAEPPVPWTDLRDYVVRCDSCERPISIRIDRHRILRRGAVPRHVRAGLEQDSVSELLDTRGRRAFAVRLLVAAAPIALLAAVLLRLEVGAATMAVLVLAAIVPAVLWVPALCAIAADELEAASTRAMVTIRERLHRAPRRAGVVDVAPGRWDQWLREQRVRERDRADHPDALLQELERVLDERELRRVRALAERGVVPASHLDDLLRHRRAFAHDLRDGIQIRAAG